MKFSIIIPVYNVEQFLAKCLDSVLGQSFDDFEVIAVNDGSTDNSKQILEKYTSKSRKLKVINQINKGLGGARNTGIKEAAGEYLLLLDSDDYLEVNTLQLLGEFLEQYQLDILAFDCNKVDLNGNLIERITITDYQEKYTELSRKQFMLFEPTACTKVYKRRLFVDNGIMFPERLWYEDLATVFRIVPYANKIGYLKEACYNYVQQPNSITHSVNTKRMMEIMDAVDTEVNFYKKMGLFEAYYKELEWQCVLHVLYYSSYRLLTCGFNIGKMRKLYQYSEKNFPSFKKNEYVLRRKKTKALMNLVINKRILCFYLHTGFVIRCVSIIKKIIPLKKWRS